MYMWFFLIAPISVIEFENCSFSSLGPFLFSFHLHSCCRYNPEAISFDQEVYAMATSSSSERAWREVVIKMQYFSQVCILCLCHSSVFYASTTVCIRLLPHAVSSNCRKPNCMLTMLYTEWVVCYLYGFLLFHNCKELPGSRCLFINI